MGSFASTSPVVTGHYTQVVWGDTKKVGCGFMYHYDVRDAFKQYPYREVKRITVLAVGSDCIND